MQSLYEISSEYQAAFDELSESDLPPEAIADTLEGLSGAFEKKGLAVAHYIANLEAEAAMVDDAIKKMTARKTTLRNRAGRYRNYLCDSMIKVEKERLNSPTINVSIRKPSFHVAVTDTDVLDDEFIKVDRKVKLAEIKKALEAGHLVEGAHLELGSPSLVFK